MKNRFIIISLLLLAIAGCAMPPSTEQISRHNFGNPPVYYQEAIINYFNDVLKDPGSATYAFGKPERYWLRHGNLVENELRFGYLVKVWVNAKNSFGGYTGKQLHGFLFNGERIVLHLESQRLRNSWDYKLGKVEGGPPVQTGTSIAKEGTSALTADTNNIPATASYRAIIRSNTTWTGSFVNRTVEGSGNATIQLPGPAPVCVVVHKKVASGYLELQIESYIAASNELLHQQGAVRTDASFGVVSDCSKY